MHDFDIAVVGSGAAGLLASVSARGAIDSRGGVREAASDAPSVVLIDSQEKPGKKILISGGGKCNLTNVRVTEEDFAPRGSKVVRNLLREFPPSSIVRMVNDAGIETFEEPLGKIFPRPPHRARAILDVLLGAARRAGVAMRFGHRVEAIRPLDGGGFSIDDRIRSRAIVLATGGRSIPKTGSEGFGLELAASLGHRLVTPRPALVPMTSERPSGLSGLTLPAILSVRDSGDGSEIARSAGSLLFTHAGVTGPVALDASLWRARAGGSARVEADFWSLTDPDGVWGDYLELPKPPGACLAEPPRRTEPAGVEDFIVSAVKRNARQALATALTTRLPRALVDHFVQEAAGPLSGLTRDSRREAARSVVSIDLGIRGDEGFRKAEVTAGGVPLEELRSRTLESRIVPGLHFCGEVVDVTGRLGGFNFQWAWLSGVVAGKGAAATLDAGD